MRYVDRLVEAGIRPDCAVDTAIWYMRNGDEDGLARYVAEVESRVNMEASTR